MAVTLSTSFTDQFKNKRSRAVKMAFSTTDTSKAVEAGVGYTTPIGGYTDYTLSGNTFTFVVVGASSAYANVLFVGG